ncbi:MAG: DUF1501 domain-containing protein [Gemmatimonadetes bacterium]|nr:DUF1501 domain-containing protein [Gemmatimonadota bacterium]MBK7834040.1 DUF1501 domain-containing protein [Gemmatimonadota bacterium]
MSHNEHDDCACTEYNELVSRREFLGTTGGMSGAALYAWAYPEWLPKVSFADSFVANRDVIVSVFLRGGADGLSLCAPFGDPLYYTGRPTIAIPRPDSTAATKGIALDSFFSFPQAMRFLVPAYQAGDLLVVHGAGLTYNTRSHFDAQHFMEVGKANDQSVNTGWLGRHLATTSPMKNGAAVRAIGISDGLVDTLKGGPQTVPMTDPANYGIGGSGTTRDARTAWLQADYTDSLEPAKTAAMNAISTINLLRSLNIGAYAPANGAVYPNTGLARGLRSTAALIKADIGVEAVHLDIGGWDTHTDQNPLTGGMSTTMTQLSGALGAFWQDCISSGLAQNVTVVVLSEFGRNVRENGSRGTDHGRGTAMFAMGRGIRGGRVLTNNWRPLAQENLVDRQDLAVSIDYRDILGEIVQNRLGNSNLSTVFPGYVPAFRGVTK